MSKRIETMSKLREMTNDQLIDHSNELRKQLFALRLSASTEHVKDYSQFKKLRRDIARVESCLKSESN